MISKESLKTRMLWCACGIFICVAIIVLNMLLEGMFASACFELTPCIVIISGIALGLGLLMILYVGDYMRRRN